MCSYGVFDSPCRSLRLSPFENKIGGYPDFYPDCLLTSAPTCPVCYAPLVLLIQLYCPLEGSSYHRLLHVFCCTQPTCSPQSKCWLVLRSQSLDPSCLVSLGEGGGGSVSSHCHTSVTDWCNGGDIWGSDEEEMNSEESSQNPADELTPALSNLTISQAALTSPSATKPTPSQPLPLYKGPCYASGYIAATSEQHTHPCQTDQATRLLERYRQENPDCLVVAGEGRRRTRGKVASGGGGSRQGQGAGSGGGGRAEQYEKTLARHGDEDFLKFQKELSKCPQQLVRYCWKGEPVVPRDRRAFALPEANKLCSACGSPCVFECQLMPALVYIIQTKLLPQMRASSSEKTPSLVEFCTVLIFSCSASCWQQDVELTSKHETETSNFRKELAIVQSESE